MRTQIAIACFAFTSIVVAQSPLLLGQPMTSPNQGNTGGGVYFDLTVTTPITIDSIDYVASDTSPAGNSSFALFINLSSYAGNIGNPSAWTLVAASTPVAIPGGVDTAVTGVLTPAGVNAGPLVLGPGTYGIALQAVGHSWGYQNGSGSFANADLSVTTGAATNAFLTLPAFTPRTINGGINYIVGGIPLPFADKWHYGAFGCYRRFRTFYEMMPSTTTDQDLSNISMYMTFDCAGNCYDVDAGGTQVVPPTGSATTLSHGDDSNVSVPLSVPILYPDRNSCTGCAITTQVVMSANGYVVLEGATGAGSPGNPNVEQWLDASLVRVGNWHDFDPSLGGSTTYEFDANLPIQNTTQTGGHVFTWLNVPDGNNASTSNTFQMVFFVNGDIELRWGDMSLSGGGALPTLVGFTLGHNSCNRGNLDFMRDPDGAGPLPLEREDLPLSTDSCDSKPYVLDASDRPVLGTTITLDGSQEGPSSSLGVTFIGTNNLVPPFDLAVIGAPGCFANIDPSMSVGFTINNFVPLAMSTPLAIPNNPALVGVTLYCQSIWLDPPANALGMRTSNGVGLTLGSL